MIKLKDLLNILDIPLNWYIGVVGETIQIRPNFESFDVDVIKIHDSNYKKYLAYDNVVNSINITNEYITISVDGKLYE